MFRFILLAALLAAAPVRAVAPPLTFKDVALMARSGFSETEILTEARIRRVASAINPPSEKLLRDGGVPDSLITKLKGPEYQRTPQEDAAAAAAASAQRAAAMQREQNEATLLQQRRERDEQLAVSIARRNFVQEQLDGKLLSLQGSEFIPYSASGLRDVRIIAFYVSANYCAACRDLTPEVLDWYRRTKAQHPEFELILVANDHSLTSAQAHVRKYGWPGPIVRFDAMEDPFIASMVKGRIPWMVAVSRAGNFLGPTPEKGQAGAAGVKAMCGMVEQMFTALQAPNARLLGE